MIETARPLRRASRTTSWTSAAVATGRTRWTRVGLSPEWMSLSTTAPPGVSGFHRTCVGDRVGIVGGADWGTAARLTWSTVRLDGHPLHPPRYVAARPHLRSR